MPHDLVVGASSLDVAGLLALVANLFATGGLLGAVARVVTRLAAVVAPHAVDALARHVAVAAAGVAGLAGTAVVSSRAALATLATLAASVVAATIRRSFGAMTSNVAHITALVALGRLAVASGSGALARKVTGLAALVARLVLLHRLGALTAQVALVAAVVALSRAFGGAVASLMTAVAA